MPTLLSPQIFITETDMTVFSGEASGPTGAIVLRNTYKGRENDTVLVTSEVDLTSKFGQPTEDSACYRDLLSAIAFLQESNSLYCTRTMPLSATFAGTTATSGVSATFTAFDFPTAPILGIGTGNVEDPDFYPASADVSSNSTMMKIIAKDRGYCGNSIRVAVCDKANHDLIRSRTGHTDWETFTAIYNVDAPLDTAKEFMVVVQECTQGRDQNTQSNWSTVEWWNVSNNLNKINDVGQSMYVENVINTNSQYIRVAYNPTYNDTFLGDWATSEWQQLNGGRNNDTATNLATALTNEVVSDPIIIAGYSRYANAEDVALDVFIDADKPLAVKTALVNMATKRKDCMAIIDCYYSHVVNQAGLEEQNLRTWMINWRNSNSEANTSYAAVYGNWLDVYDKYNSKYRWMPASGYIAAVFARCQNVAHYWSTPAGFARGSIAGVRRLAWNPTQAQRDGIYKYSINPIVSFAGQGKVVYGHKTMLDKYSAFNRINVRRMFISIENDISKIARTFLFEANNTYHRNLLVTQVKNVLDFAKANDGVDDYKIVCDDSNNTPERVQNNELWCDIYVKPTYVADYILINFIATKSSSDFTELAVTTV